MSTSQKQRGHIEFDSSITERYDHVLKLSNEDWVMFGYSPEHNNKIIALQDGTGGLDEVSLLFNDDLICWVFLRCELFSGDNHVGRKEDRPQGIRVKYLFITWVGENIPPMKRAATTTHKLELRKIIQRVSVEIDASSLADITTDAINKRLNASGAEFVPLSGSVGAMESLIPKSTTGSLSRSASQQEFGNSMNNNNNNSPNKPPSLSRATSANFKETVFVDALKEQIRVLTAQLESANMKIALLETKLNQQENAADQNGE